MSSTNETKLWSRDGFREDDYIFADDLEAAGDAPAIVLPLAVWLELGEEHRRSSNRRIGVSVSPGERLTRF